MPDVIMFEGIRKRTLERCVLRMKTGEEVIVDGEIRDRAVWAADVYAAGPAAAKFFGKKGLGWWRNSLLALAKRQYPDGKLPACVDLNGKYRILSRWFDSYGLYWILSAREYLKKTRDPGFEEVFLGVAEKAGRYYSTDGLYRAGMIDLHWNWTILRPRINVENNALFYAVTKKEGFRELFWRKFFNQKSGLLKEPGSKAVFLDGNCLAVMYDLVPKGKMKKFILALRRFETPLGPRSYIGNAKSVVGWHKDLICPFTAYLYVRALMKEGDEVGAKRVFEVTMRAGEWETMPEFWKTDGRIWPGTSLCHSWGTFGGSGGIF